VKTNPKGGSQKNLSPPVPRIGTTRSKPKKAPDSVAVSSDKTVATEDIAKLAYALWEARGGNGGSAEDDWYRAEQEIRARS
jgi:Protein of unknown function (DUF2934)